GVRGGDARCGFGGAAHRLPREVLDVGIAGGVPTLDADAETERDAPRGAPGDALLEAQAAAGPVFEEQICVVATPGERDADQLAADLRVDPGGPSGRERSGVGTARSHRSRTMARRRTDRERPLCICGRRRAKTRQARPTSVTVRTDARL